MRSRRPNAHSSVQWRASCSLLTASALLSRVDALGQAAHDGPKEAIGDALAVLQGEHVVTIEGGAWRGLHELRSRVLTTLLHQAPPPTLAETWSKVARVLPAADAGWLLRRIAEQDPDAATQVTRSLASSLASPARTALQVATALEGAERADNAIYARDVLPILQREARGGVSVHQLVLSVYPVRHQRMTLPSLDDPTLDASMRHIERIAAMLPERRQDALVAAASDITPARLVELVTAADLEDAVRVLEATAGVITIDSEAAHAVIEHFWRPADLEGVSLFARLIEQASRDIGPSTWAHAIRPLEDRLQVVTMPDPTVISIDTSQTDDEELVVTVRTMLPPHAKEPVTLDWDTAPRGKGNKPTTPQWR